MNGRSVDALPPGCTDSVALFIVIVGVPLPVPRELLLPMFATLLAIVVPPFKVTAPPKLFAPLSVSVPTFCLVTEPVPLITPLYVPGAAWSNTSAALSAIFPCRLVESPCSVPVVIVVPPL